MAQLLECLLYKLLSKKHHQFRDVVMLHKYPQRFSSISSQHCFQMVENTSLCAGVLTVAFAQRLAVWNADQLVSCLQLHPSSQSHTHCPSHLQYIQCQGSSVCPSGPCAVCWFSPMLTSPFGILELNVSCHSLSASPSMHASSAHQECLAEE